MFSGRPHRRFSSFISRTSAVEQVVPVLQEPPCVRVPGDLVDFKTLMRNWHTMPAVGFNSILKLPVYKFERVAPITSIEDSPAVLEEAVGEVMVPNDVFGVPLRKDLAFRVYQYHRHALAGYQETMQFHKWEWVGRNAKHRKRLETGASRMGRRKAPGKYEGVFAHPLRPKDWRQGINRRVVHKALKVMLSAKFAQGQVRVVDSFNIGSHKTKHVVSHLRNLLGPRCNSALLVHEGHRDVNDNFRWACAHLPQVRRENVEGVSVYMLAKYRELVITEKALQKLTRSIQEYPVKRKWVPVNATPDGAPAPVPQPVPGWNSEWIEKRKRLMQSEFRGKLMAEERRNWKWSPALRGPLKVPARDALAGFRLKDYSLFNQSKNEQLVKFEFNELFADEDPIELDEDDDFEDDSTDSQQPIDLSSV